MSKKVRNGLIIGGISLAGVVVLGVIVFVVLSIVSPGRSFTMETSSGGFAGGGDDAAYYDEDMYFEEEAAADMAMPMEAPMAEMDERALNQASVDSGEIVTDGEMQQQIERLIIRNGSISASVDNTRAAKDEIEAWVASLAGQGAFVVNSSESGGVGTNPYINMSIRVPATEFDATMDLIEGLAAEGTTPSISENSDDVTEEYVDLAARVESLEAARERLLELMSTAETTEALLMAEAQLTQREAEIESLQGRLRYLQESARLSRINVDLSPYILSQPVDTRWRPAETFREAIDDLLDGMRGFADFLIYFGVAILPILAIIGLIIYGIVRFIIWRVRVGREKRAARQTVSPSDEQD